MSTIGMMDGAFFVGRKEIMDWINSTLDLNLAKIEDTANGAIACQLLDIMYPGQVPMHKVNWLAKQDFEFVANYKILQGCFSKLGIDRHVDVDRLISGRYMDNLEFMQWFKKFFEMSVSEKGDYDAYGQRCKGKGGAQYNGGKKTPIGGAKTVLPGGSKVAATKPPAAAKPASKPAPVVEQKPANQENSAPRTNVPVPPPVDTDKDKEIANLRSALDESRRAYSELKTEMEGIDKERDFYFEKLRDIEVLLQEVEEKGQGSELTQTLFKILYATAEGFEPLADESMAVPSTSATAPIAGDAAITSETY